MRSRSRQRGVTLLELVIVLVVVAIIVAFVYPVLTQAITAYQDTSAAVSAATKGRYALERIAREIRDVRRSAADDAQFDIATMTASQMAFTRIDGVTVTITGSGTKATLGYSTPAATSDLVDQLTNAASIFQYLKSDGSGGAGVGDVRYVEITLMLSQASGTYSNRMRLALRNPQ